MVFLQLDFSWQLKICFEIYYKIWRALPNYKLRILFIIYLNSEVNFISIIPIKNMFWDLL